MSAPDARLPKGDHCEVLTKSRLHPGDCGTLTRTSSRKDVARVLESLYSVGHKSSEERHLVSPASRSSSSSRAGDEGAPRHQQPVHEEQIIIRPSLPESLSSLPGGRQGRSLRRRYNPLPPRPVGGGFGVGGISADGEGVGEGRLGPLKWWPGPRCGLRGIDDAARMPSARGPNTRRRRSHRHDCVGVPNARLRVPRSGRALVRFTESHDAESTTVSKSERRPTLAQHAAIVPSLLETTASRSRRRAACRVRLGCRPPSAAILCCACGSPWMNSAARASASFVRPPPG